MSDAPLHLAFDAGTLVVTGGSPERLAALPAALPLDKHARGRPRPPPGAPPLPPAGRAPARREAALHRRGALLRPDPLAFAHQPRPLPPPARGGRRVVVAR